MNVDEKDGETILVLLDLTAAFDTIDHELFIKRFQSRYGVGGTALNFFKSYLHNRSQSVIVDHVEGLEPEGPNCTFGHFEKIDFENFGLLSITCREILDKT